MSSDDPTRKLPEDEEITLPTPNVDSNGVDTKGVDDLIRAIGQQLQSLRSEIRALDSKMDARLHDTRPIWEGVQTRLGGIQNDIRNMDRKIDALNKNVLQVQADQIDLQSRVLDVEKKVS